MVLLTREGLLLEIYNVGGGNRGFATPGANNAAINTPCTYLAHPLGFYFFFLSSGCRKARVSLPLQPSLANGFQHQWGKKKKKKIVKKKRKIIEKKYQKLALLSSMPTSQLPHQLQGLYVQEGFFLPSPRSTE